MATDNKEGLVEKVKDFFTQRPDDHAYENHGGDDRVPPEKRTADPKADANEHAASAGEDLPYPGHERTTSEPWVTPADWKNKPADE